LLTSRVSVAIASVRNAGSYVRCDGLRRGFEGKAERGSRA
jgi:hypothetical protein